MLVSESYGRSLELKRKEAPPSANMLSFIMIGKINERVPENERISYFWWGTEVRKRYKQFYPASTLSYFCAPIGDDDIEISVPPVRAMTERSILRRAALVAFNGNSLRFHNAVIPSFGKYITVPAQSQSNSL